MNVIDLVPRSLEMGRKSPVFTFTRDGEKCELYFREGQGPYAVYDSLRADDPVFQEPGREGGNFQIRFEAKTRYETTMLSPQGLLIEGLRLIDEAPRDPGGDSEEEDDVLLDS